jgi:hypothetical protein
VGSLDAHGVLSLHDLFLCFVIRVWCNYQCLLFPLTLSGYFQSSSGICTPSPMSRENSRCINAELLWLPFVQRSHLIALIVHYCLAI